MRMRAPCQQEPKENRMPFKYVLVVPVAFAAYVLGAKAGEERYREITRAATRYWNDPKLKKTRARAEKARDRAARVVRKSFG